MVLGGRSQLLEISLAVGLGCKPTEDGLFPVSLDQLAARRPSQNSNLLLSGYKESQPFCSKQMGLHTACVPARSRLFTRLQERGGTRQLGETQLVLPLVSAPQPRRARPAVTFLRSSNRPEKWEQNRSWLHLHCAVSLWAPRGDQQLA